MIELYRWFSLLDPVEAWLVFGAVMLVLGLIPYTPMLYGITRVLIKREKAKIHTFEYAFSPDHKLAEAHNNEFYLLSPTMHFIIQGGEILITWHVTGAWRVDIDGIGKNLKGNAAKVIVNRNKSIYTLTAHTLKGKLRAVLQLPADRIFDVKTTSFAQDRAWTYDPVLTPVENFSFTRIPKSPSIGIPDSKISFPENLIPVPETSRLWPAMNYTGIVENDQLNTILDAQKVVRFYPENLSEYEENGEHLFFSSAKKLREKLRREYANQKNNTNN
jgi:hypothetical protein